MLQSSQYKRVKERYIWEVIQKVKDWRTLFRDGLIDQSGNILKLSLHEAAEYVGIPKKTLEDYQQLLKKAATRVQLSEIKDKKMGFLRRLIKDGKIQKGKPGRKPHKQTHSEQESTTHEQVQTQQQQYPIHFLDEQVQQESQDLMYLPEHHSEYPSPMYLPVTMYPATPEDMIIDGDIQPESFDWEEQQMEQYPYDKHTFMIIQLRNPEHSDYHFKTPLDTTNPFFDENIDDLFEKQEKTFDDLRDIAEDETDCED